jgi:hypothetical protein
MQTLEAELRAITALRSQLNVARIEARRAGMSELQHLTVIADHVMDVCASDSQPPEAVRAFCSYLASRVNTDEFKRKVCNAQAAIASGGS